MKMSSKEPAKGMQIAKLPIPELKEKVETCAEQADGSLDSM